MLSVRIWRGCPARLTHGYLDTFRILGLSVFRIRILALPCIQYSGAVCGYRCISALCIQYADTGCIRHNYTGNSDVLCIIRIMYCIIRIICSIPPRIIGRKAMLIWNPMKSKTCPGYASLTSVTPATPVSARDSLLPGAAVREK